jgi:uncharacterized protein YbjT (DUF2867 family)
MQIAIAGATGSIGAPVAAELARRGHRVRRLSRRSPEYPVDLETGAGLASALDGCEVLVDATNGGPREGPARAVLIDGGRRLLEAAAGAGIGHHVCISIVGIERVPMPYYEVKVEQEALVADSGLRYSIVRSTQFHTLLDGLFSAAARYRLLPGGRAQIQPVDPLDVAVAIAAVSEGEPAGGRLSVAGPEVLSLRAMARAWRRARAVRAVVVPAPLPPKLGRALRAGALTEAAPEHRGELRWEQWLAAPRASSH